MSEFHLNDTVDKEKIFLTNLSDIGERLDPYFYNKEFTENLNRIGSSKYTVSKFREIIQEFKGGPMGFHLHTYDYRSTGIPLLKIGNLKEVYLSKQQDFIFISEEKHNELKASQVKPYDLIFSKAGKVGEMSIVPPDFGEANLNQALSRITLKKNVIPEYVWLFFKSDLGKLQIFRYGGGRAVQDDLKMSEIQHFKIILPDMKKQLEIVEKYKAALIQKQQKEIQAKQLLASIDEYLLNELGITLPEKDNSLENRIFTTSLSKVSGGRFDPFYFLYCIESPKSTKYDEVKLKEIANIIKGQSITSADIIEGEYPVIAGGQTSPYSHNEYNHSGDVITISASGAYSGFAWYHTSPIFASDCSVVKSRNETICNTEYLFNVLKLKQTELYNLQQGSGQPHVYPSDIYKIGIPLPDIDMQIEINEHIRQIREQVKQLQKKADEELDKTKQEVEQIILGSE